MTRRTCELHWWKGWCYRQLEENDLAIPELELALRDDPEDDEARLLLAVVYNNKGDAAYDKGDWASALASVERAIALNPKKLYLHNKAVVLYQMGRHREALGYVRRARRSPPDPIEIVDGQLE